MAGEARKHRSLPWLVAAALALAAALAWRACGATEPPARVRSAPKQPVRPAAAFRPDGSFTPAPLPPPAPAPAPDAPAAPAQAEAPPPAPEPLHPPPLTAVTVDPIDPHPELPPCGLPLGALHAAWQKRDWEAAHALLGGVLERQDCSPGEWYKLNWAYYDLGRFLRDREQRADVNPAPAFRALYRAMLATFDNPGAVIETSLTAEQVSPPDAAGYRRVEGTGPGGRAAVLTQQDAAPGAVISFWAVPEPAGADPALLRDVSQYAPLADPQALRRLRTSEEARARMPAALRREVEAVARADYATAKAQVDARRAALRDEAQAKLAETDARDAAADEAALRARREALRAEEERIYKGMGAVLQILRATAR
jgi:hypothetical protein